MTTDTLARAGWIRAGRAAVIVVALTMAAISYAHIRDLALAYGGDGLTAPLLPLGIDGAVAAMTVFMHQAPGLALHLARCVLMAAVGMTVACNTAYGAAFGVTGALLWSSPAVLFVGCVEVSVLMVRKTRPATVTAPGAGSGRPGRSGPQDHLASGAPEPAVVTVRETEPRKTTAKQEAVILGRSLSAVQRYRRDGSIDDRLAAVSANGREH